MHLPFKFSFDPTPGGTVAHKSFVSLTDNLILAVANFANSAARALVQLGDTNLPSDTQAVILTALFVTVDSPVLLHIEYDDGAAKHLLLPIVATLGGNGGVSAPLKTGGLYIPQKLRLRVEVPAAYTADAAAAGIIGGFVELLPVPTGHS